MILAEGGGIEPLRLITVPRFSGPLAVHSAAPSALAEDARVELAKPCELYGLANRCIAVLPILRDVPEDDEDRFMGGSIA